tara:strand:+ start:2091 stop:4244 length:2154 start_codon:yes stop_codon:yes gene_type:complete
MSLENLKSIFSPTSTKFQDTRSDLTTLDSKFDNGLNVPLKSNLLNLNSKFDDGLNTPIQSNLLNFNSIFDDGLNPTFPSNVLGFNSIFDDGLNVPTSGFTRNGQTFSSQVDFDTRFDDGIDISEIYTQNQPQDKFDTKFNYNDNSLIMRTYGFNVEMNPPILDSLLRGRVYNPIQFSQDFVNDNLFVKPETGPITDQLFKTQTFDPRASFAKEGTLYFNTNNSFNPATNPTDFSTAIGNNDSPYTPLTDLGGQFNENLSWENLYNPDHTPKNIPEYKGIPVVNYGPNVNRDNLKIGTTGFNFGDENGLNLVDQLFSGERGTEPYKVSPIGTLGREMNDGSRFLPLNRALEDGDRILQFLKSPAGVAFLLKQNVNIPIRSSVVRKEGALKITGGKKDDELRRVPQRFGATYNPLSPLLASVSRVVGQGVPNILAQKHALDLGLFVPSEYGAGSTVDGFDVNETFTSNAAAGGGFLSNVVDTLAGALSGKVKKATNGDKMTLHEILSAGQLSSTGDLSNIQNPNAPNLDSAADGMPFYFKDLRTSEYIFFRAYIEGLTENIQPAYTPHNYMGRSEPVYTYERAERELNFTLKLVAQTEKEFDRIYEKLEHLTSLCYPEYVDENETAPEGETGYGQRMKTPLTRLRYGDMYGRTNKELMGYIKSLSYSIDQSSTYDTRVGKRAPKHIIATIGYQVIHNQSPSINMSKDLKQKFYGVNERL